METLGYCSGYLVFVIFEFIGCWDFIGLVAALTLFDFSSVGHGSPCPTGRSTRTTGPSGRSGDPSAGPASGSRALHPPWCGVVAFLRVSQQAASRRLVPIATPYGVAGAGAVTSLRFETSGLHLQT